MQLLHHLRHHRRAARLVTGTEAATVVAVEILMKQQHIAPMGITLK